MQVGFSKSLPVMTVAQMLGLNRHAALGIIGLVQDWASRSIPSMRFDHNGPVADEGAWAQAVEAAVGWNGQPGALWHALLAAGLLKRDAAGVSISEMRSDP
jgi:hypothetical protein